jgi:hypothetical protein
MSKLKGLLVVAILVLATAWALRAHQRGTLAAQAPRPADGVLVGAEPTYGGLDFQPPWLPLGSHQAMAVGTIDVSARVLSRRDYPPAGFGQVLPTDLVLGWGPMSDNRVIDHVAIRQEDRGMVLQPDAAAAITTDAAYASVLQAAVYSEFRPHSQALAALRVGDVIHLYGWRMKLQDANGTTWAGGTGHEAIGQRAFIVQVLMLQVGDRKVFGNWEAYRAP